MSVNIRLFLRTLEWFDILVRKHHVLLTVTAEVRRCQTVMLFTWWGFNRFAKALFPRATLTAFGLFRESCDRGVMSHVNSERASGRRVIRRGECREAHKTEGKGL